MGINLRNFRVIEKCNGLGPFDNRTRSREKDGYTNQMGKILQGEGALPPGPPPGYGLIPVK